MKSHDKFNKLTPREEEIIIHKGTEPPFTGEYNEHFSEGVYACRYCDAMLYWSKDKFKSSCGWPSFDDEIQGAVKKVPDADGSRTEITCANCGGHLGHVFSGEEQTLKNIRHCVNSISLNFVPNDQIKTGQAIFAGGCFWGVEYYMQKTPGVLKTTVGYIGGHKDEPSYEEVCSKTTGHVEAVEVVYDPVRVSYEELVRLFFEIHDPTQAGRQGPDVGEQYSSIIFYRGDEQKAIAEMMIGILKEKGYDVVTRLKEAGKFWKAEDYHQEYYNKKSGTPYCHVYTRRFD
ncbi:MAG: bifunctional methionine sulfoxide reductase B/A protein [Methanosarcinales archaeon]|nr:bifunctional methionine sulfoxide reductase B/A protein [Methanosarcinales archaeon]